MEVSSYLAIYVWTVGPQRGPYLLTGAARVLLSHGGTNEVANLRTMCRSCNSRRGNRQDR
ncbi:HNH endonuclease [Streptomyces sp. NPDC001982]|uniref:HNH endonuclease n=1 Tax=Streptomyces sp. NPDC001982 TaxID=3154405 RepID=UPI003324D61F